MFACLHKLAYLVVAQKSKGLSEEKADIVLKVSATSKSVLPVVLLVIMQEPVNNHMFKPDLKSCAVSFSVLCCCSVSRCFSMSRCFFMSRCFSMSHCFSMSPCFLCSVLRCFYYFMLRCFTTYVVLFLLFYDRVLIQC